jgi:hypothetical protein
MLPAMNSHDDDPARRRAERVRLIRRRVVGGGVGLFAAVWLLITATLVSGKDPGLAATKTTARVTTARVTTARVTTAPVATKTTAGSTSAAARSKASTATPSPVTTQQS